jgi:thiopeptide-type bacteriocin biosynthesis protein
MASADLSPSGFCVLRTPLLPFDELEEWSRGLRASSATHDAGALRDALTHDRSLLRERLVHLLERPEIREALFLASSTFHDAAIRSCDNRVEEVLARYFQRMASRATPFAVFAGCTTGRIGGPSALRLRQRLASGRRTQIDAPCLAEIAAAIERDPGVRGELRYTPNTSLYRTGGRWRFCPRTSDGYQVVTIDTISALDVVLDRARDGATIGELVAAAEQGELSLDAATALVDEMLEAQILISDLAIPVTGADPLAHVVCVLERLRAPSAAHAASILSRVEHDLRAIDDQGVGADAGAYRAIVCQLETLQPRHDLARVFHVQLNKPAERVQLGPEVIRQLRRGIELLHHCGFSNCDEALRRFRRALVARFGEARAVPLALALDEGLGLPFAPGATPPPPDELDDLLLRLAERAMVAGEQSVELTAEEVAGIGATSVAPLPDALYVKARLAASQPDAIGNDFAVYIEGGMGPSGARLLGRFCADDAELRAHVEEHLRREEALDPDAVFAEVVHLPDVRLFNVVARPPFRAFEITYLGDSGVDPDRRILVPDLMISVEDDEIVLRSLRLGRRVLPRMSAAQQYLARSCPPVYRFLCALQAQGRTEQFAWRWGSAGAFAFLPRVTSGRIVLSRARWHASAKELHALAGEDDSATFATVRQWQAKRRLPRYVVLLDRDHELLVDFENILSIEAFLSHACRMADCVLEEFWPEPGRLCATAAEGRYVHELLVPFERRREPFARRDALKQRPTLVQRHFPPASEWLYLKIVSGAAEADRLLVDVVGPIVRDALAAGVANRWFFVRYAEPEQHLRVRIHGSPQRLLGEILPRFRAALAPLLDEAIVSSLQLDTYAREIERYGGAAGIELAEMIFHADSEAVLDFIASAGGGDQARWLWGVRGIHQLMTDFGVDDAVRVEMLSTFRNSLGRELGDGRRLRQQLAARFRAERHKLELLLDPRAERCPILDRRSDAIAPLIAQLQARRDEITVPVASLVPGFIHMFSNRLQHIDARQHELVLYDFLHRLAVSRQEYGRRR